MTTERPIYEQAIEDLRLRMESEFVPWSKSRNAANKSPSLNWKVRIFKGDAKKPFIETDYMAGCGHCPAYEASIGEMGGHQSLQRAEAVRYECERGRKARILSGGGVVNAHEKPLAPKFADVLSSLVSDAQAIDMGGFEEWAGDLGYETGSRKAEAIYNACLQIGLALRRAVGEEGLQQLRTAFQDY